MGYVCKVLRCFLLVCFSSAYSQGVVYFNWNVPQQPLCNNGNIVLQQHNSAPLLPSQTVNFYVNSAGQFSESPEPVTTRPVVSVQKSSITPVPLPVETVDAVQSKNSEQDSAALEEEEQELGFFAEWQSRDWTVRSRKNMLHELQSGNADVVRWCYNPSDELSEYCDAYALDIDAFRACRGNVLQQILHLEFLSIGKESAHLWHCKMNDEVAMPVISGIAHFMSAGLVFNHAGEIDKATALADVCWTLLDCFHAAGEGLVEGACQIVNDVIHPIDFAQDVLRGAYLCGNCIGELVIEVGQLGYYVCVDSHRAHQNIDEWIDFFGAVYSTLQENSKTLKLRDVIKEVAVIGMQIYATSRLLQGIKILLHNHTTKIVKRLSDCAKKSDTMITPEGIVLRVGQGLVECLEVNQPLLAKQVLVVKNMDQFFEMPFGKLLLKNSTKTAFRYQNPIYKLTRNISGMRLKKGYFYYLDRLHCDHIEVFDEKLRVAAVYNLDGLFNDAKFDSAFAAGRNIKKIMKGK